MKQYLLKVWMTAALSLLVVGGVWGQESYTPGYPNVSDITHESAKLNVSASVGGMIQLTPRPVYAPSHYTLFIVLDANEDEPNIAEVISWSLDGNGELIPEGRYGEIGLSAPGTEFSIEAYNLSSETSYVAYFVTTEDFETSVIGATEPTAVPFTTEAAPFTLDLQVPEDGASDVALNASLVATFNQNIQLGTSAEVHIYDYQSESVVETITTGLSVSGSDLIINPTTDLAEGTHYYVVIPNGAVETTSGAPFAGLSDKDAWDFTTVYLPLENPVLSPAHNDDGVLKDVVLSLEFDKDIELGSGNIEIYSDGVEVRVLTKNSSSVSIVNNNTLQIDLSSNPLPEYETVYDVRIASTLIKRVGSEVYFTGFDAGEWSFTTEVEPIPADPPYVVMDGYFPAPGTPEVSRDTKLRLTFNEKIEFGDNNELFLIYNEVGLIKTFAVGVQNVSISEDGYELIVDLSSSPLSYETEYYVVIEEGYVRSEITDAPFAGVDTVSGSISSQVWYFRTESRPPLWQEGYPKLSNMSASGFTLEVHADFPGMVYGVITMSPIAPAPDSIAASKNHYGDPAIMFINEDIKDNDNPTSIDVNGFTATEGVYYLHVVYKREVTDELSKFGEVRTLVIDKTAPKIYSTYPINEFLAFPSDGKLLVTFSERVVDLQGNALSTEDFALYMVGEEDLKESIPFTIDNTVISERTRITITPNEELTPLNSYELIIRKVKDLSGNTSESDSTTVSFETDGEFTWTGMGDVTVWEDPDNWGGTYIAGKSVRIPDGLSKYPIIQDGGNVRLHNLTVEAGGLLTQKGGMLNLTGEFHLESAADKVNASYIFTGGTLKVDADKVFVHQYIPVKDLSRVYFMGSPTLGANPINSGSGYQMRWFENQTDMWHNNGINNMTPGVGYAVYTLNNLLLCGAINTESILVKLYRTEGKGYGWNFLGNPFTSALSWKKLIDANSGIEDYIENNYWLWDPKDAIYNAFNQESGVGIGGADGTIPSNHGFLVKVKIGKPGADLTIPRSAQVENKSNFLKSTSVKPNHLKLRVGNGEYADELAVVFIDEANDGIDKFDTEKRFGDGKNPFEIYTINSSTSLSINTVPYVKNKEVGLGFVARKSGTYTIDLSELNLSGVDVILKDNLASNEINLLKDGPYTFSVNTTGTNNSRFVLKFTDSVITSAKPVELSDDELNLSYLVDNGNLYVSVVDSMIGEKYSLFDISGRVVKSDVLDTAGMVNIGRYPDGVYILTLYSNKGENTISKKIVVK
ncbi:Ig-like domain-containing protein [Xiashengella succiniciproducens]|uniref:Ig-like domain-containing protein n=1 Tax=Xiashengella succiniciproducens TaxID=2949635 RepID=A0A9J6ZNI6_9BACT|nr:Ig-like domain-containing protein [Alkaliflexus sp. Ai-910]URW78824.1 Ig-like domain-containing protein [Alkaliflexus sp. Ai-910]